MHNSRTPFVSWRFLGISEVPLALFPQEQPCRDPQQHLQRGCTQTKPDVAEETRSRVKNAFIPQKSHDLVTIWGKSQIFSNIWVRPAYRERSLFSCGINPCEKASQRAWCPPWQRAASQPQAEDKQGRAWCRIFVCCGPISPYRWEHWAFCPLQPAEKVPPSKTTSYTSTGTREPGMVSTDRVCALSLTLFMTQERNISVVPNTEKQRITASGRKKHFPPI